MLLPSRFEQKLPVLLYGMFSTLLNKVNNYMIQLQLTWRSGARLGTLWPSALPTTISFNGSHSLQDHTGCASLSVLLLDVAACAELAKWQILDLTLENEGSFWRQRCWKTLLSTPIILFSCNHSTPIEENWIKIWIILTCSRQLSTAWYSSAIWLKTVHGYRHKIG